VNLTICFRLVPRTPSLIYSFIHELFTISLSPSIIHLLLRPFISTLIQSLMHTPANTSVTHSLPSLFIHFLPLTLFTNSLIHSLLRRLPHTYSHVHIREAFSSNRFSSLSILAGFFLNCSPTLVQLILPADNFVSQFIKLIIHHFPSTYLISVNKYEFQYSSDKLLGICIGKVSRAKCRLIKLPVT